MFLVVGPLRGGRANPRTINNFFILFSSEENIKPLSFRGGGVELSGSITKKALFFVCLPLLYFIFSSEEIEEIGRSVHKDFLHEKQHENINVHSFSKWF